MKRLTCIALLATAVLLASVASSFAGGRPGPTHSGYRSGHRSHAHVHWRPGVSFYVGPGYWGPRAYWGPGWYGYPYPYYPYYPPAAVYAPPVVVQESPPVYIERAPESQPSSGYWYYCEDPKGYYPYVQQCPQGWMTVVPSTPAR